MRKRFRIRLFLPLIQVALAGLLVARFLARRPVDFGAFEYRLYRALNAPAIMLASVPITIIERVSGHEYFFFETAIRLCFIWAIWYAVSVEMSGRGLSVLTPKTRHRRAADVLAMIFGVAVGFSANGNVTPAAIMFTYPIWMAVILGFYGRDLWLSFSTAR